MFQIRQMMSISQFAQTSIKSNLFFTFLGLFCLFMALFLIEVTALPKTYIFCAGTLGFMRSLSNLKIVKKEKS